MTLSSKGGVCVFRSSSLLSSEPHFEYDFIVLSVSCTRPHDTIKQGGCWRNSLLLLIIFYLMCIDVIHTEIRPTPAHPLVHRLDHFWSAWPRPAPASVKDGACRSLFLRGPGKIAGYAPHASHFVFYLLNKESKKQIFLFITVTYLLIYYIN